MLLSTVLFNEQVIQKVIFKHQLYCVVLNSWWWEGRKKYIKERQTDITALDSWKHEAKLFRKSYFPGMDFFILQTRKNGTELWEWVSHNVLLYFILSLIILPNKIWERQRQTSQMLSTAKLKCGKGNRQNRGRCDTATEERKTRTKTNNMHKQRAENKLAFFTDWMITYIIFF